MRTRGAISALILHLMLLKSQQSLSYNLSLILFPMRMISSFSFTLQCCYYTPL